MPNYNYQNHVEIFTFTNKFLFHHLSQTLYSLCIPFHNPAQPQKNVLHLLIQVLTDYQTLPACCQILLYCRLCCYLSCQNHLVCPCHGLNNSFYLYKKILYYICKLIDINFSTSSITLILLINYNESKYLIIIFLNNF